MWPSGNSKSHVQTGQHLADEETCEVFCGVGTQCLFLDLIKDLILLEVLF